MEGKPKQLRIPARKLPDEALRALWRALDADGSGELSYDEMRALLETHTPAHRRHEVDAHMARLRGLTYSSVVLVDVVHDIYSNGEHAERRLFRETCLFRLPIMLGSQSCHTQHREDTGPLGQTSPAPHTLRRGPGLPLCGSPSH